MIKFLKIKLNIFTMRYKRKALERNLTPKRRSPQPPLLLRGGAICPRLAPPLSRRGGWGDRRFGVRFRFPKNIIGLPIILLLFSIQANAQLGGWDSFSFLKIAPDPTTVALGGVNVTKSERNPNAFLQNPALLDSSQSQLLGVNFSPYFAGTNYLSSSYVHRFDKIGTWGLGVQYVNYGDFPLTDPIGNIQGTFRANDYALTLSHARRQGNITFGGNIKWVGSAIESYSATALLMDFGGVFRHPKADFTFGMVAKNIGFRVKDFTTTDAPDLPLDVQMGVSYKPQYMPARFSLTAHHLYQYDIAYLDTKIRKRDLSGNLIPNEIAVPDKIARHFVFGTELLLSRNFNVMLAYNYLRNRELSQQNIGGLSGFSFGFNFKTTFITLSYSYAAYHAAGGLSNFGVVCDLQRIIK
jgi:hypothetical protein